MGPTVKVSSCFSVTAIEYLPVVTAPAIDPPGWLTVTCNGIPAHHFAQRAQRGRLRSLPLHMRKMNLERLLARRPDGITVAPFEHGEIGPDLFRAACRMGLEGLVSKHRDRPYQAGRAKHWVKIKNRKHPAMYRVMDALA